VRCHSVETSGSTSWHCKFNVSRSSGGSKGGQRSSPAFQAAHDAPWARAAPKCSAVQSGGLHPVRFAAVRARLSCQRVPRSAGAALLLWLGEQPTPQVNDVKSHDFLGRELSTRHNAGGSAVRRGRWSRRSGRFCATNLLDCAAN